MHFNIYISHSKAILVLRSCILYTLITRRMDAANAQGSRCEPDVLGLEGKVSGCEVTAKKRLCIHPKTTNTTAV